MAFAIGLGVLAGCSDDDTTDNAGGGAISISAETIPAGSAGVTTEIEVTSSGDWRLSGVCDWAHPSAVSGKSGDRVTFTVDPNETDEARETTFKFFTGSAVVPLKITSEPGWRLELLSDPEVVFEAWASDLKVKLKTNIPELTCEFSGNGGEWIAYEGRTDAFGFTVLSFAVAKNPDYDDRSTVLTVSGMEQSLPIAIRQRQIDDIQVVDEQLMYDLAERTISIDVASNVDYEVTISSDAAEWLTRIETRGLVTKTLQFHLDAAATTRCGKITIDGSGITKTISVIQKDPDAVVAMIPDKALRAYCVKAGWVLDLGNSLCVVTEVGQTATELKYNPGWYDDSIKSLEGIEAFPELTTVDLSENDLESLDISKLTKVTTLKCACDYLSYIDLGANPVAELEVHHGDWNYSYYVKNLTVKGEKLESLLCACTSWYANYDMIEWIDVSGCPSLQTLDCRRGSKLTTLYLKTGQSIPNLTKNDTTQIVYKD